MIEFTQYTGRLNGFRGSLTRLPEWARIIVGIFALPGIILGIASVVGILLAMLVLLVLTVPVYSLLKRLTDSMSSSVNVDAGNVVVESSASSPRSGVKHVDSTIIE